MTAAGGENLRRRLVFAALLLVLFAYFYRLGDHGLIDPDEGRYAEIPREMLETGDFITPKLNYVKYFEKPVLHYWMTAASFSLLGETEFAARLTPVLCALLGAWVTFAMARRLYGSRAAFYAAAILATCLLWFAIAHLNILDMTLSLFMTLSVAGFWWGTQDGSTQGRRYLLLFYAGMALATLSKGLIGIVLPGAIAFWYIALTRRWRLVLRALYWPGVVLFFLLTVPWFWAVCRVNGDFFDFFFIQEHFLRYTTKMHGRYQPFWFFIPILIGGLVPWAGLLPDMLLACLPKNWRDIGKENREGFFLGLWFAVPFLFFSLSSSKLIPYIIPCLPPLAILGGRLLDSVALGDERLAGRFVFLNGIVLSLLAIAGVAYPFFDKKLGAAVLLPVTLPAVASLLVFTVCGVYFYRRRSFEAMVNVLCVLAIANVVLFARGFEFKAAQDSYKEMAALIRERAAPDDVIVGYKEPMQGLFFYLKRRIVLAETLGELAFGALQEKDPRWFVNSEKLKALWSGGSRVLLVTDRRRVKDLQKLLDGNIIELAQTRSEVLLANF